MDDRSLIRLLPWRKKNRAESKGTKINFAPKLGISRENGWVYLELQLVNCSSWVVWVEEANIVLADLDAESQTLVSTGQAGHQIRQHVGADETLRVSLARAVYDAAGRPQGLYSPLVLTNVRYSVLDEWCNVQLDTCRVGMAALTVISLHSARWYDEKMKRIGSPVDLTTSGH